MKHVSAIIIALVMVGAILGITLGAIGGATTGDVLIATALIVAIAYPVGDLIVLPATSNLMGIVVDAVVAGIVIWLTVPVARGGVLLLSLFGLGIGLYFFHLYLYATVLGDRTTMT